METINDRVLNVLADKLDILITTVWDYSFGLLANFILLSSNADKLGQQAETLEDLRNRLGSRAPDEARRINQLSGWMRREQALRNEVDAFITRYEDYAFCVGGICLGYDAVALLRRAKSLSEKGEQLYSNPPESLYRPRLPSPAEKILSDVSSFNMVAAETRLREIMESIQDDRVRVIGIYGMGGVGKTALLKIINNEFFGGEASNARFEVVIWVELSGSNEDAIVRKVADRLGLPSNASRDDVLTKLSERRFALLIDDVWENPKLPLISGESKLIFTTRSQRICGEMDVDKWVKVGPLDTEQSWQLFLSKMNREAKCLVDSNTQIRSLAREVAATCGGLPVYLIAVGRAMASANTEEEWRCTLYALDHFPREQRFESIRRILESLKLSYDKLEGHDRDCFLYCALFPRDYAIPKNLIIDYWICEGFLDPDGHDEHNIKNLRDKGVALVETLVKEFLMESAGDNSVKLHNAIRNMVQWVADDHGFLVLAGNGSRVPKLEKWRTARRISFVDKRDMEDVIMESNYWNSINSSLTTLLLRDSVHAKIVNRQGFFGRTPALKVLDLKGGELHQFPAEITSLTSLKYLNFLDNPFLPNIPDGLDRMGLRIRRP